jgi:hypothetical protein
VVGKQVHVFSCPFPQALTTNKISALNIRTDSPVGLEIYLRTYPTNKILFTQMWMVARAMNASK